MPEGGSAPLDMPEMASPLLEPGANPFEADFSASGFAGEGLSLGRSLAFGPVEKLGAIIDRDEEQATAIMKHWVKNG
jgi:flagellar M-ring protein FliF